MRRVLLKRRGTPGGACSRAFGDIRIVDLDTRRTTGSRNESMRVVYRRLDRAAGPSGSALFHEERESRINRCAAAWIGDDSINRLPAARRGERPPARHPALPSTTPTAAGWPVAGWRRRTRGAPVDLALTAQVRESVGAGGRERARAVLPPPRRQRPHTPVACSRHQRHQLTCVVRSRCRGRGEPRLQRRATIPARGYRAAP